MISSIDAWVLARHQYVANWVYTRDETKSHFWLASQAHLLALAGYLIAAGLQAAEMGFAYIGMVPITVLTLIVIFAHFWMSGKWHDDWLNSRPSPVPDFVSGRKILLLIWGILGVLDVAQGTFMTPMSIISAIGLLAFTCGVYFEGCQTPTRLERKEEQPGTNLVPELG